ncbi:putative acetyltransferase [Arthrobacter sp. 35W]|uniref:putative acetyltransferase n=1 Tax=Arthrobacter sp. 35W TaxID=1132441 RepID=UPI00047D8389|nr:hypothetical protein [Arthrobacter sp. 35W]
MDRIRSFPLGTRVVIRYVHGDGATDALGELVALDAGSATVRTRRGDAVVALSDVLLAKEVPPPPAPRPRR